MPAAWPIEIEVIELDREQADAVNHPPHYNSHPSGVEYITVVEHMGFNTGNAIKYLWRAGLKDATDVLTDLRKAQWYIEREIARQEGLSATQSAQPGLVAHG
jgi:hypothetical protein